MSIIAWLIVGAIAGWIAGMVVPGDEGYGWIGAVIAAIVGAIIVVVAWKMIARRGTTV